MLIMKRIQKRNKIWTWFLVFLCLFCLKNQIVNASEKKVKKKKSISEKATTSKDSDIQSFGIRINDTTNSSNKIELNSFYQHGQNQEFTSWNVNSVRAFLYTRYLYLDFNVDWGIQDGIPNNSINNRNSNRFGLQLRQFYIKNNGVGYFGITIGTHEPFPVATANGGFYLDIGQLGRGGIGLNEVFWGKEKTYFTLSGSISKQFGNHELTLKPYYSRTLKDRLNLILKERFYIKSNASYVELQMVSGYYPDSNTFINYERIDDALLRISAKGHWEISSLQAAILPVVGYESFHNRGSNQSSYYAQIGLRVSL